MNFKVGLSTKGINNTVEGIFKGNCMSFYDGHKIYFST